MPNRSILARLEAARPRLHEQNGRVYSPLDRTENDREGDA
jgi:hypothetical protein